MAKNELRFGIGAEGVRHSSIWRVWVQGDEVYLAPRGLASLVKMSIHSSGVWRWAWTGALEWQSNLSRDRLIRGWRKPEPFMPGWVMGPSVMFPWAPVEGWDGDPIDTERSVLWLDPPSENQKITVTILLGDSDVLEPIPDLGELRQTPRHAEFRLRSGGRAWICSRQHPMALEEMLGTRKIQADRPVDPDAIGGGGTAIVTSESHGAPLFLEVRVPKRQRESR